MSHADSERTVPTVDRRTVLATIGAGTLSGFAGCAEILRGRSGSIGDRDPTPVTDGSTAWPTGGFDTANTSHNPESELLAESFTERQITQGGAGIGSFFGNGPAVADDQVYFGTVGGTVVNYGRDGERRWSYEADRNAGARSVPTITRDVVYVATPNGLFALDRETGEELWTNTKNSLWRASPTIADGLLFTSRHGRDVAALDVATGDEQWRADVPSTHSLAAAGDTVYASSFGNGAVAVRDGEQLWLREDLDQFYADPVVDDEHVFLCTNTGRLVALDRETGETEWEHSRRGTGSTTPAVAHGQVYLGSGNGQRTVCLDATTGDVQWRLETDVYHNQPVAVDDGVYFGTPNNGLYAVEPDGTVRWRDERFRLDGSMAVAGRRVYVTPFVGPFGNGDIYELSE